MGAARMVGISWITNIPPLLRQAHLTALVWLSPRCELLVWEVGVITLPRSHSLAGFLRIAARYSTHGLIIFHCP